MSKMKRTVQRTVRWSDAAPYWDDDSRKIRAHFAGLAYAHHLAIEALSEFPTVHFLTMRAAFIAALCAGRDETGMEIIDLAQERISGGEVGEWCFQWLRAAGVDPDTIAPAQ